MRPDSRTRTQPVVLALVTDIVCVVVFCTAGGASHAEARLERGLGTAETAWPFLAGNLYADGIDPATQTF